MGDIVGGIIGGIGSIIGGNSAAKKDNEAAKSDLTGFNYLNSNPLINNLQAQAGPAAAQQTAALGSAQGAAGDINSLLTSPSQNNPAFQNYLNSTGYGFQLQQGTDAITGNAASKGLLNSGSTARALTSYGQNLASGSFNNYLGQLGGLASTQQNIAAGYGAQVGQGLTAAQAVGQAGTTGGANAGNAQMAAGQATANGLGGAFGAASGVAYNYIPNFFGQPAEAPH